jgi:hypothetical protein
MCGPLGHRPALQARNRSGAGQTLRLGVIGADRKHPARSNGAVLSMGQRNGRATPVGGGAARLQHHAH